MLVLFPKLSIFWTCKLLPAQMCKFFDTIRATMWSVNCVAAWGPPGTYHGGVMAKNKQIRGISRPI